MPCRVSASRCRVQVTSNVRLHTRPAGRTCRMSIYATLWELKFPLFGRSHTDCEWERVLAQGVPEHVGEDGDADYLTFLPPRKESMENGLRAVVFIRALQSKGTDRSAQEYPTPLLMLKGKEYNAIPFGKLHEQLVDALRGAKPRVAVEVHAPSGAVKVVFTDGRAQLVRDAGEA
jgi:hypothetical protein